MKKTARVTNTSGEIQLLRKAAEMMGPRTDFDLLRIMSHQLEKAGTGQSAALQERRRRCSKRFARRCRDTTCQLAGTA